MKQGALRDFRNTPTSKVHRYKPLLRTKGEAALPTAPTWELQRTRVHEQTASWLSGHSHLL